MAGPDPTRTPTSSARRRGLLVGTTVVAALVLLGGGWLAGAQYGGSTPMGASPDRQAEVFQRGSTVMPFDQAKTTHIFKLLGDGGTQVVIANDPADQRQITLAQRHLREEAAKFARGDLAALERAAVRGTIAVRYQALANGALLR